MRRALVPDLAALDGSGNQGPSASLRVVAQSALLPATLLGRLLLALLRPMNVRWLVDATVAESAIAVAVGVPAVPQANSAAAEGTAGSCLTGEFHFSKAMCVSFPAVVTLRRPRRSEEPCGFRKQALARSPSAQPGPGPMTISTRRWTGREDERIAASPQLPILEPGGDGQFGSGSGLGRGGACRVASIVTAFTCERARPFGRIDHEVE